MSTMHRLNRLVFSALPMLVAAALGLAGCGRNTGPDGAAAARKEVIANIGSDTMVNLATVWAEAYAAAEPGVSVEVTGGGSGQGIAALINGACDLANCSRRFEEREVADLKTKRQLEPCEFLVGYDALCVLVHKNNPLEAISIEELAEMYKADGKVSKWSDIGVTIPGAKGDEIIRVSRQNNSGTYQYFKEAVVGKANEFRLGSVDMNGSKDVIELIARTPNAIGYSGMGYITPEVKALKISRQKGEPAVVPSIATTLDKTYPIARPLLMYTAGEPAPRVKKYIDWVMSEPGQKIVEQTGYVHLAKP